MTEPSSSIPNVSFDNIINFRDVGRTINQFAGKKLLKEGVLFRSARLDEASEEDIRRLTDDLNIRTIIDLRSTTEHHMAINKYKKSHPDTTSEGEQQQGEEEYIHLPSLVNTKTSRHLISLTGRAFEKQLLWQLDWWNFAKVLTWLAAGYRQDAVKLIGEHVMKPAGLTGLAMTTLVASTAELKHVFDFLGASDSVSNSGVLIHCTQGKDRTGLIILLSLLLTGAVNGETIAREYVLSEKELEREPAEEKEERMREIRALGLTEEYARCPKDFTERVTEFLVERYGGVREYFDFIGVEERVVENVGRRFLA
ncbi:protein-tyrosine phosphatase-like protein [Aspergillus pseudodeflectus]|uniref:Protein-tyrosine phosphatase-like protein n=1 Tax=Aspergillus pseudodeflectus TaxID=176178 RepID=A0ABR4JJU2_9EURO